MLKQTNLGLFFVGTSPADYGIERVYRKLRADSRKPKNKPTRCAVWWAENEPVSDGGNPPRPIRLFRMTEHSTQDLFASRVPVHSALVQKSVTTSTNSAGRLSPWMLGNRAEIRKRKMQNSWQEVC